MRRVLLSHLHTLSSIGARFKPTASPTLRGCQPDSPAPSDLVVRNFASEDHPNDWHFIAERPALAPHLARPEGRVALRIVLGTVLRVSRSLPTKT